MMMARRRPILSDRLPNRAAADRADVRDGRQKRGEARIEMMLYLQERGVGVLRAVAEEVEGGHQYHGIHRQLEIALEHREHAGARRRLPLLPSRRLIDAAPDEEDQDCRQTPEHEHVAPAQAIVEQIHREGSEEIARRITHLQQA